ncbi:MAG: threonine synthase, partial [Firmicutes bacterium]|nr:threonine synthase [Bacillota bacterium]
MKYVSTRGQAGKVTSAQAILGGLAPDGGLFLPVEFPHFTPEELAALVGLDYQALARKILGLYLSDFAPEELGRFIAKAYGENFATSEITPLTVINENLSFLELWHGPTCAFKDLALQLLPYLLTAASRQSGLNKEIVLLVATSGDTGKAALAGFKDVPGTKVIVFYPEDGVSAVQKRQMVTQEGANVYVVGIRGNFDQAQAGVKAIFADGRLRQELEAAGKTFSSANSINWGRLVPQIVYYFKAWADLLKAKCLTSGESFNLVVPTGNFGNILAAYYGKKMGLPLHKLICASNANNVLTDFIRTGEYNRKRSFYQTSSPSMDILVSSNLERLLYELTGEDASAVRALMEQLRTRGSYRLTTEQLHRLQTDFWASFADEEATKAVLKEVYTEFDYLIDPHTAVGYKVYADYVQETGDRRPTVIAATASPFKFNTGVA